MENNNMENTEASWKPNPIFLFIPIGFVVLLILGISMLTKTCGIQDVSADTTTVATIDIIPESSEAAPEAPSEPTIEETLPPVDPEALELLAIVIYRECGADSCCDECRRRVADVVLNRVESPRFPNNIRSVLTQENQYWKMWETGVCWPEMAKSPGEKHAVERAYRIAEEVLRGRHSEIYGQGYIWQALFVQGNEGFWCCGTYFGKD